MKILFLDDDEERHRRFKLRTIGCDVTHVRTYTEALAALELGPYDEVWLDHDLSDAAAAGQPAPDEKTGYHVACFIAESLAVAKRPTRVIIHSFNFSGAYRMGQALAGAGIRVRKERV